MKIKVKSCSNHNLKNIGIKSIDIQLEQWSYSHFSKINQQQLETIGVTNFLCPSTLNYDLYGNFYSNNASYFQVDIIKWNGVNSKGVPCKSLNEINNYIDSASINVFFI